MFLFSLLIVLVSYFVQFGRSDQVNVADYPFMVSVEGGFGFGSGYVHLCGGVIVSENYVLSEHTFGTSFDLGEFVVRYDTSLIETGGTVVQVTSIHVPPNYDEYGAYDVSILSLETPITFGPSVQPVLLPDPSFDIPEGSVFLTIGWRQSDFGLVDDHLQSLNVTALAPLECLKEYTDVFDYSSGFCARCPAEDTYACLGDAGGALLSSNNTLLGIYSWQSTDIFGNPAPGLFAKITAVLDFVNSHINP